MYILFVKMSTNNIPINYIKISSIAISITPANNKLDIAEDKIAKNKIANT